MIKPCSYNQLSWWVFWLNRTFCQTSFEKASKKADNCVFWLSIIVLTFSNWFDSDLASLSRKYAWLGTDWIQIFCLAKMVVVKPFLFCRVCSSPDILFNNTRLMNSKDGIVFLHVQGWQVFPRFKVPTIRFDQISTPTKFLTSYPLKLQLFKLPLSLPSIGHMMIRCCVHVITRKDKTKNHCKASNILHLFTPSHWKIMFSTSKCACLGKTGNMFLRSDTVTCI